MQIPKISVLMPVYNAEKYLAEAVESVLNQTFQDFEFIIIDDGSNDYSLEIIRKYALIDSRIKFFSHENKGLVDTLNEGIDVSKGKYIARMDADDVCLPFRFEKQHEYLESNNDAVVVGSRIMLIDEDGDYLCAMVNIFSHEDIDFSHINNLTAGAGVVHPTAIIRRDALVQVGGYNQRYKDAEDIDVWLKLAEIGKIHNLNEILLNYRQHFNSIGYTSRKSQLQSIEYAVVDACIRRQIESPEYQPVLTKDYIKSTKNNVYVKWGWWALNGKNVNSARKYAKKSILSNPFNIHAWKLLVCSIRGY